LFYWLGHGKTRILTAASSYAIIGKNINTLRGHMRALLILSRVL
jgi:hypothetical protein